MRIVYIVPGFGNTFYCQNCIQNLSTIKSMIAQGHDVTVAPMYIPFSENFPQHFKHQVFYGAINVYLTEYSRLFKKLPNWLSRLLNSTRLLRWIAHKSGTTDPKGLEQMTLSVMQGENGDQREELNALIAWLKDTIKPDVVHLSNALLIGIGAGIKQALNIPVMCTVQDENQWIDRMESSYAQQAWQTITDLSGSINAFIAPTDYYASYLQKRANLSPEHFEIIPSGIDTANYQVHTPAFDPPIIGYLSRISDGLGISTLLQAFEALKQKPGFSNLKLKISGGISAEDKKNYHQLKARIDRKPYAHDVLWVPDLYKEDINAFFDGLSLLCVPSPEPEALGLFLFESMAAGIPVVQPAIGGYAEVIKITGGGIAFEPNTWQKLTETLEQLLLNPEKLTTLGAQGRLAMEQCCTLDNMVSGLMNVYKKHIGK